EASAGRKLLGGPRGPFPEKENPTVFKFQRKRRGVLWMFLFAVFAWLGLLSPTRADEPKKDVAPAVKQGLTPEQRQKNIESFDLVWQTVRDTHYDPKLGGVTWEAVRTELRPRLEKAATRDEARAVMNEMLGRLGHTHVAIIPASLYEDMQGSKGKNGKASQQAVPGFDVRAV